MIFPNPLGTSLRFFVISLFFSVGGIIPCLGQGSLELISGGWNAPTAGQFARDVAQMPGELPLTGCIMTLHADSGPPDPLAKAHDTSDWKNLDVRRSIDALANSDSSSMPDNYLLLKANPGNVDWLDQQGWNAIVEHYSIAAGYAKRGRLKGLLLDFEPYTEPYRQFQYSAQANAETQTFDRYKSAARQRGREVMVAIRGQFPDAEIYTFFSAQLFAGRPSLSRSISDWPKRF